MVAILILNTLLNVSIKFFHNLHLNTQVGWLVAYISQHINTIMLFWAKKLYYPVQRDTANKAQKFHALEYKIFVNDYES